MPSRPSLESEIPLGRFNRFETYRNILQLLQLVQTAPTLEAFNCSTYMNRISFVLRWKAYLWQQIEAALFGRDQGTLLCDTKRKVIGFDTDDEKRKDEKIRREKEDKKRRKNVRRL
ncbi:hypothetical protein LSTR_LSTR005490 [Laodelphax striatellus]|uniref:Uncharacterized protein n=1 Tax=Laodelphax striatellus TaxID=195883 RepID=A0A482WX01_LAOST|nr:hypothetical protein LSTR_LSTR005490 [Laodelphax striatellus]